MTYIYIYVIICIHTLCSDTPQRYKSTSSLRYIGFYFSICLRIYSTIKQLGLNNSVVTSCECVFVTWATKFWWYQRNHDVGMVIFFKYAGTLNGIFQFNHQQYDMGIHGSVLFWVGHFAGNLMAIRLGKWPTLTNHERNGREFQEGLWEKWPDFVDFDILIYQKGSVSWASFSFFTGCFFTLCKQKSTASIVRHRPRD